MGDYRLCRLSVSGDELELAGSPEALRALGWLLREHAEPIEVEIKGGRLSQQVTEGPLLVSLPAAVTLHVSDGPEYLEIVWDALDGAADMAETAEDRSVNRHVHIEHFPDDEYRSPDSVPVAIVADWPAGLVE